MSKLRLLSLITVVVSLTAIVAASSPLADPIKAFLGMQASTPAVTAPPARTSAPKLDSNDFIANVAYQPVASRFAPLTDTIVTIGGGATVTCPATPTATYTTPPTGVSFSNWSRGTGVTCASASNAISGSGFNTASFAASFAANKFYSVTITADATHGFTLKQVVWATTVSSGGATFDVQYINNGGALTAFGTAGQTSTSSNTFNGSVFIAPSTSIVLYLIPSGTGAAGTTLRWVNGSTITVEALVAPTVTTSAATSVTQTSATMNGNVTSDGGATVVARGFYYKLGTGVTSLNGTQVTAGLGTGAFTGSASPLLPGTQYSYIAYATNSVGTTFSSPETTFTTTLAAPGTPTISGSTPTSPSNTSTAPTINGTADIGSTVNLYTTSDCSGASLGSQLVTTGSFAIGITVNANATTNIRATATNPGGPSGCSGPFSYTHDDVQPTAPSNLGSTPTSPNPSLTPNITGNAESGTTVKIYRGGVCTLANLINSGASSGTFSIGVSGLVANSVNVFSATATDAAGNVSNCSSAFTYYAYGLPTITGLSPSTGPTIGGTSVVITGTNFFDVSGVSFGATPATSVVVNNSNQITVPAPPHAAGMVDVRVTTPGGTSAFAGADQFTYFDPPTITADPTSITFTNVPLGTTQTQTTTLTGSDLESGITCSSPNGTYILLASNGTTFGEDAHFGSSGGTLTVQFTAVDTSGVSGNIICTSEPAGLSIPITATVEQPAIAANPTQLDFDPVVDGQEGTLTTALTTTSVSTQITCTSGNSSAFILSSNGTTFGEDATFSSSGGTLHVRFTPAAVTSYSSDIVCASEEANVHIPVSGNGITDTPGAALNFDGGNPNGADDVINIPEITQLNNSTGFTFETWVNMTAHNNGNFLAMGPNCTIQDFGAALGVYGCFGVYADTGGLQPSGWPTGSWGHLAVVFDGTGATNEDRLKVYFNGVAQTLNFHGGTVTANTGSLGGLRIGTIPGVEAPAGSMDEVRIWRTARTEAQIAGDKGCEITDVPCGLMANYHFNEGSAGAYNTGVTTLTDATPNHNDGTLTGFTLHGATSNWVSPGGVVTGTSCPLVDLPEADLFGPDDTTAIADGSSTAAAGDGTAFGSQTTGSSTPHTFKLHNTGSGVLHVTGASVSGTDNDQFDVATSTPFDVAAGATADFVVSFDPTSAGDKAATVHVLSDDCDEGDYDFAVSGVGQANEYSLTLQSSNGTIDASPTPNGAVDNTKYIDGTSVDLTPNPAPHYHFVQWSGTDDCASYLSSYPCTVTMNTDRTVTTIFAIDTFTVTPSSSGSGTITPDTPQTVNYNETTQFTLIPDTGYYTDSVTGTCGGSLVTNAPTRLRGPHVQAGDTFTTDPVIADCTVIANFAINTYTLTYTAGAHGSISGDSPQTVNYGADGSAVTAVPDTGFHFVDWSDGSTQNPRTDTNVQADVSVTANFAIDQHTVTFDANGGTGTMNPQTRDYNDAATLTANTFTRTGFVFIDWNTAPDGTGTSYADEANYDFTADLTLYAQWSDTTPPVISYTPVVGFSTVQPLTDVTFNVTVTDNVAVDASSVKVNYSFDGGATYQPEVACPLVSGDTYSCTIQTPSGSSVAYYVAAMDTAGNKAFNPGASAPNLYAVDAAPIPGGTYTYFSPAPGSLLGPNSFLNGNVTVLGIAHIENRFETGAFTLTLECGAVFEHADSNNFVVGNVRENVCATGHYYFPIGTIEPLIVVAGPNAPTIDPGNYSPFNADVTAFDPGSALTVTVTEAPMTGANPIQSAHRYWSVTETGSITANISFTYLDIDVFGTESAYKVLKRDTATNVYAGGTVDANTNTGSANGVTSFSQWGAGNLLAPTAAGVTVSGRVLGENGRGLRNAVVQITDSRGVMRSAVTGETGYYKFDDIEVGQVYVVAVESKRYTFSPQFISVRDSIQDLDFTPSP